MTYSVLRKLLVIQLVAIALIAVFSLAADLAYAQDAGVSEVAADVGVAPAPAPAPTLPDRASSDPGGVAWEVVQAMRGGHWRLAVAGSLALLMLGLAKLRSHSYFAGDRGGAILVGVLALSGAITTALAANAPLNGHLFLGAVSTAFTAVGGYTWIRRIIAPKDEA